MNDIIKQQLSTVINVLNSIHVSGKQDCVNMGGCIGVLEEIADALTKHEASDTCEPEHAE